MALRRDNIIGGGEARKILEKKNMAASTFYTILHSVPKKYREQIDGKWYLDRKKFEEEITKRENKTKPRKISTGKKTVEFRPKTEPKSETETTPKQVLHSNEVYDLLSLKAKSVLAGLVKKKNIPMKVSIAKMINERVEEDWQLVTDELTENYAEKLK